MNNRIPLKIGLYLQTEQYKNDHCFREAMKMLKNNSFDILVFPEDAYFPTGVFDSSECSLEDKKGLLEIKKMALDFSKEIRRAVVICSKDENNSVFSIYANAWCENLDTKCGIYVKHTATSHSAFDFDDYNKKISDFFPIITYKRYRIGLNICYDCTHSAFSRMYGLQDVDVIINSTGGNVDYNKWKRYNKVRAIENNCYTFVTMGNNDETKNYVFGFNREGGELIGRSMRDGRPLVSKEPTPGDIYIYNLSNDEQIRARDELLRRLQEGTLCFPVNKCDVFLKNSTKIKENLHVVKDIKVLEGKNNTEVDINLVIIVVDGDAIFKSESHLALLYDESLKKFDDKRYLILCRYHAQDEKLYAENLSDVLKVRATENYCAVIFESKYYHHCCLPCRAKNVQVIEAEYDHYILDTERMKGPELIWKNKINPRMRKAWRGDFEALVRKLAKDKKG